MPSYSQAFQNIYLDHLDKVFAGTDVYVRESIKDAAKAAMASCDKDIDVSDAVMDYIRKHYNDNGNIVLAHMIGTLPKTLTYHVRHDNVKFIKELRADGPPAALSITTSCNGSIRMPYVAQPNEPVAITCTISGGEDPEGEGVIFSLAAFPSEYAIVEKTGEREFAVTFTQPGLYALQGTAQEREYLLQYTQETAMVEVLPSVNNPPTALTVQASCGNSVELEYGNNPNEPVTVTFTLSGGEDPEGGEMEYSLKVTPTPSSINKISARKFDVTFSKTGTYTIEGTAKEVGWLEQISQYVTSLNVLPSTNNPPSEVGLTLSCGESLQLGTNNAEQTITATITGGVDPEGKKVTMSVECSTASKITKSSETEWKVTLATTGIHVIIATATDPTGLKSVKTAMVKVEGSSQSSGSSTGQFTDAKFDSGWSDLIQGCYVSAITFSLTVSSGHSSSNDYLVILGKKSNGTVVILHDNFNTANRFKTIAAGSEVGNSVYTKGNLSSKTHSWDKDPYVLSDDIRQVRFVCETPGHADCASKAKISYEMEYTYDSSLS